MTEPAVKPTKPTKPKRSKSPAERKTRTIKPGTYLNVLEDLMREEGLTPGDPISSVIDVLESTIVAEARGR